MGDRNIYATKLGTGTLNALHWYVSVFCSLSLIGNKLRTVALLYNCPLELLGTEWNKSGYFIKNFF
jgi:hypothetical protein